jgi:ribose 5-phosphate isomerase B
MVIKMKIAIGCDHGGYLLKQEILAWLEENGYEYEDVGCYSRERTNYPIFGEKVGRLVASGACERGIVLCTTGVGISIAANKVRGIRCANCADSLCAEMSRRHNDANVLAIGAGLIGDNLAKRMVEIFLTTEAEGGRHANRVAMLDAIEP